MEGVQLSRSPRSSRPFGWGAGIVALGGSVGAVAGALWGLTRPGYTATVEGGAARIDPAANPDNVEFISFAGFTGLTALLGLFIGLTAFATAVRRASAWRMLFAVAVAAFSSWTLYVLGTWSADMLNGVPDPHDLKEGETLTFVPLLRPGAAWLAGPFVAALTYWLGLAVSPGLGPGDSGGAYDERHAENH